MAVGDDGSIAVLRTGSVLSLMLDPRISLEGTR